MQRTRSCLNCKRLSEHHHHYFKLSLDFVLWRYIFPSQSETSRERTEKWKKDDSVKEGGKGETEVHSTTNQFWAKAHTEVEDVEIGSVKMCTCWRCFMHLQRNIYPNMQTLLNVLQSALTQSFQTTL